METTDIVVEGMTCAHCKGAVEAALSELTGVESAQANLETGKVSVCHDGSVEKEDMQRVIEGIGFELA